LNVRYASACRVVPFELLRINPMNLDRASSVATRQTKAYRTFA